MTSNDDEDIYPINLKRRHIFRIHLFLGRVTVYKRGFLTYENKEKFMERI